MPREVSNSLAKKEKEKYQIQIMRGKQDFILNLEISREYRPVDRYSVKFWYAVLVMICRRF